MTREVSRRTITAMGTLVTAEVVGRPATPDEAATRDRLVDRALAWFDEVETRCTRFDAASELMQLGARVGEPVVVSPLLFEALQFALAVAAETGGAFDPTVGREMAARGFDRHHRTGQAAPLDHVPADRAVSYRDVDLDPAARTITLQAPLVLDLGAVAKGLAVDLAARELAPLGDFAIDAGGDLYLSGRNREDAPWAVGIRHPRAEHEIFETIRVSDRAVCTSGDYERRAPAAQGHHILDQRDPRARRSADAVASVTVVAPTAMLADAVATAAFVLGPDEGLRLFDRLGVEGLIVTPALDRAATPGFGRG